eukprot:scaffold3208_cov107-Cylindrotheca_fusiformis.AAC.4
MYVATVAPLTASSSTKKTRIFDRVTAFSSLLATSGAIYSAGSGVSPPCEEEWWDMPLLLSPELQAVG